MSTIRFSGAITALVTAYTGAGPLAGVVIADGVSPTALAANDFIIIGHDGTLSERGALADVTEAGYCSQEWMAFPAQRDETGAVHVVAVSQTGDSADLPGRRDRAQALLAACEDAAIAITGAIEFDGTLEAHFLTRQDMEGCAVMAVFTVGYACPY